MLDLNKFSKLEINTDFIKDLQKTSQNYDIYERVQKEQQLAMDAIFESRDKKEKEELRRHNELISALKNAAENGATIIIGDNANGLQIQQNAQNASQSMTNSQSFNYEQALDILNQIKEYFEYPQFEITFKDKTDEVKQIVEDTLNAVKQKDEPSLIKKSLKILKDLSLGVGSSLIASGIIGLLSSIPL